MKLRSYALALIALPLTCTQVSAQQIAIDGVLRTYSALLAIRNYCPKYVPVDRQKAYRLASLQFGVVEKFGGPNREDLYKAELVRRVGEVTATGSRRWCLAQRERWRKLPGGDELFP